LKILTSLFILCFSFSALAGESAWMDRSHTIFLPQVLRENLSLQMELPYFWWNFVVIEPSEGQADFPRAQELCRKLEKVDPGLIEKTACPSLHSLLPLIHDWAMDQFLRTKAPSREDLKRALIEARGKASLPMGRELLNILREDPLESYLELKNLMLKNVSLGIPQEQGFFVDPATHRIVLPLQFSFSPQDVEKTKQVLTLIAPNAKTIIIGAHISAFENQQQIFLDLDKVSLFGFLVMAAQLLFILVYRRWKFLWLIPPVIFGVTGAAGLTVLIFGSIHGLTLSLGTGIIALALDFGLHSALNTRWPGVWRANLFGLLTTFAGLMSISLSGIPLLRQMMVFAMLGLIISYGIYYFLHSLRPGFFHVESFTYVPRPRRWKSAFTALILGVGIYGLVMLPPNLNMHQFDFQTPKTRETMIWLYSLIQKQMPIFSVRERDATMFARGEDQDLWGRNHSIVLTNFSQFLPSPEKQITNGKTWQSLCAENTPSEEEKILFAPFWSAWPCENIPVHSFDSPLPAYLKDTVGTKKWLTIWFPRNEEEITAIKNYDTQAFSLTEMVQKFPLTLGMELRWMVPLSLVLCLLLLWLYYRDISLSLITLIPFFSGVGFYFCGVLLLGWSFSFISIIALIMVFGLSIDYGIFATNLYTQASPPSAQGVWSCLWLAAMVTLLGFLPLAFCRHPVLTHLGQTLAAGTLGTWLGTAWGIPGVFSWKRGTL
jgi:hypothetical protein